MHPYLTCSSDACFLRIKWDINKNMARRKDYYNSPLYFQNYLTVIHKNGVWKLSHIVEYDLRKMNGIEIVYVEHIFRKCYDTC